MRIEQLNYFLDVCETQSLNQSAKRLFITQPAITKSIHKLEEEFGTEFFTRTKTGIFLNHAGHLFKPYAENIVSQYTQALSTISRTITYSRPISIITNPILSELFAFSLFDEWTRLFPNLEFRLNDTMTDDNIHNVFDQIVQSPDNTLAIITTPIPLTASQNMNCITFLEDEIVVFLHKKHPYIIHENFSEKFLSEKDKLTIFWGKSVNYHQESFSNASSVSNLYLLCNLVSRKGYLICLSNALGQKIFMDEPVVAKPTEIRQKVYYQLIYSSLLSKEYLPFLKTCKYLCREFFLDSLKK